MVTIAADNVFSQNTMADTNYEDEKALNSTVVFLGSNCRDPIAWEFVGMFKVRGRMTAL
jgi:hypothetical protein